MGLAQRSYGVKPLISQVLRATVTGHWDAIQVPLNVSSSLEGLAYVAALLDNAHGRRQRIEHADQRAGVVG
jgi:hypothetical protein